MASAIQRAVQLLSNFKSAIFDGFSSSFPKENFALAASNLSELRQQTSKKQDLKELFSISILWGVPKRRRSIEKRRSRRFGWPEYFYKMLVPKTNILSCTNCGSYHEAGVLCPQCYSKVKKETEEMQEAIQNELGLSLVESEVVVLYQGDDKTNSEYFEGKRIVEMKKKQPKLFSDNLLQKSTKVSTTNSEVSDPKKIV